MKFDIILFDADNTLFDFDAAEAAAFAHTFADFGLPFAQEYQSRYRIINQELWNRHERGELALSELVVLRFQLLFKALGIPQDAQRFNAHYLDQLANNAHLMEGALPLCQALRPYCTLHIVTNGVSRTQHRRIALSPLKPYLSRVFVSEELGCKKPQPEFFDAVFAALGQPDRSRVLLVGDSLTSDMQGGNNAGIATCWFNPQGKPRDPAVKIHYEIRALGELGEIVGLPCPLTDQTPE